MPPIESIAIGSPYHRTSCKTARRTAPFYQASKNTTLPIVSQLRVVEGKRIELPFADEKEYQCFYEAVINSLLKYEQVRPIVEGNAAHVNLGGPYGANLTGLEGVHSLIGWDRAYSVFLGPRKSFCVKGSGASRSKKHASQSNLESYREFFSEEQDEPPLLYDKNFDAFCDDHGIFGGNDRKDLFENAHGAYTLLRLAYGIDGKIGGIILPLGVHLILSFPFPKKDKNGNIRWKKIPGWNYFTNIKILKDKKKIINVAEIVRDNTNSKILHFASRRFIKTVNKGKRVSRLVRWLVGRAFMNLYQPATYEYIGDEFRVGHVYRQLVSNGYGFLDSSLVEYGLLDDARFDEAKKQGVSPIELVDNKDLKNKYIDKVLSLVFSLFGKEIRLPERTECNLRTKEGRISYFKQVRELNKIVAEEITELVAGEIGRQLGILHGCGGDAGGHEALTRFGDVTFVVEKKDGNNEILFVRVRLINAQKVYTVEIFDQDKNYFDPKMDLGDYKIVGIIQGEQGIFSGHGVVGGGGTRSDNVGYGLRDLHSVSNDPASLLTVTLFFAKKINNLNVRKQLFHYHTKLVQEADLEMLFAQFLKDNKGSENVRGAFYQLNEIFGGGEEVFQKIADAFWGNYNKYYRLSREKYASEVFMEMDFKDAIYVFRDTFRELEMRNRLDRYIEKSKEPQKASGELALQGQVAG